MQADAATAGNGRAVLVTGAAKRVGAAIVERLHADGWRVVIHAHRSRAEAEALAARLNANRPDSAAVLIAELGDDAATIALAAAAAARWGRLDALVNNASAYRRTPFGGVTPAVFEEMVASNFRAPLLLTQACVARFAPGGAVVNILDTLARHARPGFAPYAAAKSALWSLTETLAVELAPQVRVNAVAPGHILWADATALTPEQQAQELSRVPLGRLGRPQEIAAAVAFLLGSDSAYLTGVVLPVDGGLRLLG